MADPRGPNSISRSENSLHGNLKQDSIVQTVINSGIRSADSSKTLINEPTSSHLLEQNKDGRTRSSQRSGSSSTSMECQQERFSTEDKLFLSNLIEKSVEKSCEATYGRLESRLTQVEDRSSKNHTLITKCMEELLAENLKINQRIKALETKPSQPTTKPDRPQNSSTLIFTGVSDSKKIKKIIKDLGITLSGLINVTPVNKKKAATVEFSCHWDKSSTYRERTKLRGKGHVGVFINEVLTPSQGKIFYLARCAKKQKLIKSTWTQDGSILVSKEVDGEQQMAEVKSQDHLLQLVPRLVIPEEKPNGKDKATAKKWSSSKVHQASEKKKKAIPTSSSESDDSESDDNREEGELDTEEEKPKKKSRRKAQMKGGSRR